MRDEPAFGKKLSVCGERAYHYMMTARKSKTERNLGRQARAVFLLLWLEVVVVVQSVREVEADEERNQ